MTKKLLWTTALVTLLCGHMSIAQNALFEEEEAEKLGLSDPDAFDNTVLVNSNGAQLGTSSIDSAPVSNATTKSPSKAALRRSVTDRIEHRHTRTRVEPMSSVREEARGESPAAALSRRVAQHYQTALATRTGIVPAGASPALRGREILHNILRGESPPTNVASDANLSILNRTLPVGTNMVDRTRQIQASLNADILAGRYFVGGEPLSKTHIRDNEAQIHGYINERCGAIGGIDCAQLHALVHGVVAGL